MTAPSRRRPTRSQHQICSQMCPISSSLKFPACPAVQVQRCTLLSIKTGGCPETCTYCAQSSSWSKTTGLKAEKLMGLDEVYQVQACLTARQLVWLIITTAPLGCIHDMVTYLLVGCQAALRAKEAGSTRFCMGAAWRGPSQVIFLHAYCMVTACAGPSASGPWLFDHCCCYISR